MKCSVNRQIGSMTSRLGLAAITAAALALPAHASPQGAQVVHGSAAISQSGGNTTITAGNNAIINYQSFSVGSNESVRFVQPSSSSRVLNRVTGSDPSRIAGSLSANGIVYLVNPAGIYFSQGARINVAGLYAAGGKMSDSDFLQHIDLFKGLTGSVVNDGHIVAGTANLLGQYVANHGQIDVPNGTLTMLAGHNVYMRNVDGHIMVKLDGKALGDTPAAGTKGVNASLAANPGVDNSGSIHANGSHVTLGAGDLYALAVRNTGEIQAGAGSVKVAANDGAIQNSGSIAASGHAAGSVSVIGPNVVNTGSLAASSTTGNGGSVTVLGNHNTFLTNGSAVSATGLNGGHVLINTTNGVTHFMHGASIDVSGTNAGGNVEVSGRHLAYAGSVNLDGGTSAGSLLLDPYNLDVVNNPSADITSYPTGGITFATGTTTVGSTTTVSTQALESVSSGIVTLKAINDLTVADPLSMSTGVGLQLTALNNLTINAPVSASSTGDMNFTAGNNLIVNSPISSVRNLTLNANGIPGNNGVLTINANITGVAGAIKANGYHTVINTPTISSTGYQTWSGQGVAMNANATTMTGSNVKFLSGDNITGSSNNLSIVGSATLYPTVQVNSLTVSGLTSMYGGSVTTTQNQTYKGDVLLGADTNLTGNDMTFGGTIDGAQKLTVNAVNNILFAGQVGGTTPLSSLALSYGGLTSFAGPGIHTIGDITFNTTTGRSTIPLVATITGPNGDLILTSDAGIIVMGANEKFSDLGNLTLNAGSSVVLGDVSTLGNFAVNAPAITINRRAAGQVELPDGTLLADAGTDFVAGGQFAFSTAPTLAGSGSDPRFASPASSADVNGNLPSAVLLNRGLTAASFFNGSTVLDLTYQAPISNLAPALPGASAPDPLTNQVAEDVLLGPAGQQAMGQLALNVRPFSVGDLRAKLLGHQTINDVTFTSNPASGVNATVYRVYRPAAENAIHQYQALFTPQTPGAHGKAVTKDNTAAIRQSLASAWSAYTKQVQTASGNDFVAFLAARNGHKQALAYLQQLHTLMNSLTETGLTNVELNPVKSRIIASVTPDHMKQGILRSAIGAAGTPAAKPANQPVASRGHNEQARADVFQAALSN